MMRILLLAQFYPPIVGGEERHVRNLGAALAQRGHAVTVATLWYPGAAREEQDGAVRVLRMRGTLQRAGALFSDSERRHAPPFPDPELVTQLAAVMRDVQPDIVHAHNWIVYAYLPLRPFFPARLVQTLHDYSVVCVRKTMMTEQGACAGPSFGRCLPCAARHYGLPVGIVTALAGRASAAAARSCVDRYLAVSRAVAESNGLGDVAEVVPNFIPDALSEMPVDTPLRPELPAEPYLLFVGDLNRQKGVPVLLEAYRRLRAAPPLVLIGRSFPETSGPLPASVRAFHSWPHADVMGAWRGCLFGIAPSVWAEPCATVVMEGLAFGKPMVVTDTGGMPDLVQHAENGLLVPPGNAGALADALQRLIDDSELRNRLSAEARRRIPAFTASRVVERIDAVYARLAGREGPGAPSTAALQDTRAATAGSGTQA